MQCKTKLKATGKGKAQQREEINFAGQQENCYDGDSNTEYVFAMDLQSATTIVGIGGKDMEVILDSGASSNILTILYLEDYIRYHETSV